jgi:5-formyltetrahydrofolate cyclo-ligase
MLKNALRKQYKELRKKLTEEQKESLSLAIANQLLRLPIWEKTYFHVFLPIETQNEVNTEFVLHLLWGKDKEILISRSDFMTKTMTHFLMTDNTRLQKNEYEIPEPVNGIEVSTAQIDVVFVPLLAFDQLGNRVGYGQGFYDRFLKQCKPQAIKIGLSFFEAVDLIEDTNPEDIRLDYCVTPEQIYSF